MKLVHIISILTGILALSCTGIVYDVATTPEGSRLDLKFDFSGAASKPDSLPANTMVLMSELVSTTNYLFDRKTGFSISRDNDFPVKNGDYFIISVATDQKDLTVRGVESFLKDSDPSGVSVLEVGLTPLTETQIVEKYCPGLESIAFSYPAVPEMEPLYVSIDNRAPVYFREAGDTVTVTLKPAEAVLALDFKVKLELEEGVAVDSMFAAISGVPYKLTLMDGVAPKDSLGKTFFKMAPVSGEYASGYYAGTVRTMGLFSADFGDYITGPGIFWMAITASCEGRTRVIGAGLNLKEQIDSVGIMKSADEGQNWTLAVAGASFEIDKTYTISKEMIMSGGTDGSGDWIPVTDEKDPIVIEF